MIAGWKDGLKTGFITDTKFAIMLATTPPPPPLIKYIVF
jgi:hypothetical protein